MVLFSSIIELILLSSKSFPVGPASLCRRRVGKGARLVLSGITAYTTDPPKLRPLRHSLLPAALVSPFLTERCSQLVPCSDLQLHEPGLNVRKPPIMGSLAHLPQGPPQCSGSAISSRRKVNKGSAASDQDSLDGGSDSEFDITRNGPDLSSWLHPEDMAILSEIEMCIKPSINIHHLVSRTGKLTEGLFKSTTSVPAAPAASAAGNPATAPPHQDSSQGYQSNPLRRRRGCKCCIRN